MGKITLIEAVLRAMPTYFMSLFKVPIRVANSMEKIMRDCLWDGAEGDSHCHVVAWHQVCNPKVMGGLGLGNLRVRNKALVGK